MYYLTNFSASISRIQLGPNWAHIYQHFFRSTKRHRERFKGWPLHYTQPPNGVLKLLIQLIFLRLFSVLLRSFSSFVSYILNCHCEAYLSCHFDCFWSLPKPTLIFLLPLPINFPRSSIYQSVCRGTANTIFIPFFFLALFTFRFTLPSCRYRFACDICEKKEKRHPNWARSVPHFLALNY